MDISKRAKTSTEHCQLLVISQRAIEDKLSTICLIKSTKDDENNVQTAYS